MAAVVSMGQEPSHLAMTTHRKDKQKRESTEAEQLSTRQRPLGQAGYRQLIHTSGCQLAAIAPPPCNDSLVSGILVETLVEALAHMTPIDTHWNDK